MIPRGLSLALGLAAFSPIACRGSNTTSTAATAAVAQVNPNGSSGCSIVTSALGAPIVAFNAAAMVPFTAAASGALAADATGAVAYFAVPGGAPGGPAVMRLDVNAGTTSTFTSPAQFAAVGANISALTGIAILDSATLLVVDGSTNQILAVTAASAATFAGLPNLFGGFADGPVGASTFRFTAPTQIAVGGDQTVYVADPGNNRIRTIAKGLVTTIAGSGIPGFQDGTGSLARFDTPDGITIECAGSIIITEATNRIRRITFTLTGSNPFDQITTATVSSLVGDGSAASLDGTTGDAGSAKVFAPAALNVSNDGTILWLDRGSGFIRRILPGATTVTSPYGAPSVPANGSFGFVCTFDGTALLVDGPGNQILGLP